MEKKFLSIHPGTNISPASCLFIFPVAVGSSFTPSLHPPSLLCLRTSQPDNVTSHCPPWVWRTVGNPAHMLRPWSCAYALCLTPNNPHTNTHSPTVTPARSTTCPGLCCLFTSQGSSCLGTLGSSPAFHIQVQDHEAGANSWRCAEGAWRLPQQMNHHGLIFNSRLLLPSSISPSSPSLHTAFLLIHPSLQPPVLQVSWHMFNRPIL